MPITWTHENVSRLFLVTLAVHHIHMDYKQIAAAFGGDASPRAIEEKMKKLRKEAREFSDGGINFSFGRGRGNKSGMNFGKGSSGKSGKGYGKGHGKLGYKNEDGVKDENGYGEDDSEGESNISPRGYGDLMENWLLKKEKGQDGDGMFSNVDQYPGIDPVFTSEGFDSSDMTSCKLVDGQADEANPVMDPMLTNNFEYHTHDDQLQLSAAVGVAATTTNNAFDFEDNLDLRDLNNSFRAINHHSPSSTEEAITSDGSMMDIDGEEKSGLEVIARSAEHDV